MTGKSSTRLRKCTSCELRPGYESRGICIWNARSADLTHAGVSGFLQSQQWSGCSAEETSCERVGLAGGVDLFSIHAVSRLRRWLHRGRPNYWPGHGRGLIECHTGWQRVRRAVIHERFPERHAMPHRGQKSSREAGKRELRVGAYAPPRLEPAPLGAVRREDIYTNPSVVGVQRR